MNTSKLADIAEITSSIAILVTLVFLVVQMQQNTAAIQAQTRDAIFLGTQDRISQYMANPDIALNEYKSELTDEEKIRFYWSQTMFYRARENDWFQYQSGVLNEDAWASYSVPLQLNLSSPNARKWWAYARRQYDPSLLNMLAR